MLIFRSCNYEISTEFGRRFEFFALQRACVESSEGFRLSFVFVRRWNLDTLSIK